MSKARLNNQQYNYVKFCSYLLKHYEEFKLNEIFNIIEERKNNLKAYKQTINHNKPIDFMDLVSINLLGQFIKSEYILHFDLINKIIYYISNLFFYLNGFSSKYLQNIILDSLIYVEQHEMIKSICDFVISNKYIVIYDRNYQSKNILFKILFIGDLKKYNKEIKETRAYANEITGQILLCNTNKTVVDKKPKRGRPPQDDLAQVMLMIDNNYINSKIHNVSRDLNTIKAVVYGRVYKLEKVDKDINNNEPEQNDLNTEKEQNNSKKKFKKVLDLPKQQYTTDFANYKIIATEIFRVANEISLETTNATCELCNPRNKEIRKCENCRRIFKLLSMLTYKSSGKKPVKKREAKNIEASVRDKNKKITDPDELLSKRRDYLLKMLQNVTNINNEVTDIIKTASFLINQQYY